MKIATKFMAEVPVEKRDLVKRKLIEFARILPNTRTLLDIPKGFWVRQVVGTDIYKFRVNSGDRILFRYAKIDDKETIVFLSFQSHDNQIRAAKNATHQVEIEDFEINQAEYVEEIKDHEINDYVQNELQHYLKKMKGTEVFEDEYIDLAIETNSNERILSLEQYYCLSEIDQPVIVFGCAGSGKTSIALRKLLLNHELTIDTIYVTKSEMIIEKTKELLSEEEVDALQFYSLKDLLIRELDMKEAVVIEYDDFVNWIVHENVYKLLNGFPIRDVWLEINTLLKGGNPFISMQSRESYINEESSFYSVATRKIIYTIADKYNIWLQVNNYYDLNDLAYLALTRDLQFKYENIIFDEVQELTNKQLQYLLDMTKQKKNLLLLGDIHQLTQTYHFDLNYLKDELFKENLTLQEQFINKNYRSGHETVNLINELKELKWKKFKHERIMFQQKEVAIRVGEKPIISRVNDNIDEIIKSIQDDVDTIFIVSDQGQKAYFEEQGITRVFTIEETRGLEYNKVYAYNILTAFKETWYQLFSTTNKVNDLYRTYFNLIYLAITRSKKQLYLIEKETTVLERLLEDYFEYREIEVQTLSESSTKDWLDEANKLYRLKKYSQAADAYEKAGELNKRDLCIRLDHHNELFQYNHKYECFMDIQMDKCTPKHIEAVLDSVKKKYKVSFKGQFNMRIPYKEAYGKGYRKASIFIQPYLSHEEVATLIYEQLEEKVLERRTFVCKVTLFANDLPVLLNTIINLPHNDISIRIKENTVTIESVTLIEEREIDMQVEQINTSLDSQRLKIIGEYNYQFIEENIERYKDLSGEQILTYILGG